MDTKPLKTRQLMVGTCFLFLLACLTGCSGGAIEPLQPEVNGPFDKYFLVTNNAPEIERLQDGDFVRYGFNLFFKVKEPFACTDYFDTENSVFPPDQVRVYLKFYDADKKPLPINGIEELTFFTHANTTVGKDFCAVINKPANSEGWFTIKTRNFKKESEYFEKYPTENIKYFSIETGK